MAQVVEKTSASKLLMKWLFSLIVPAIVYFALPIDGKAMTHEMAMFLAVTIFMVCVWGFELVNDTATGLVLPVLYMALCGVPGKIVYNNWLGDVPNIVIGGFIFCKILQDTGLGKRIGLGCMKLMGGSFIGTIWGLMIAVYIINPLVPAITGKGIIFCAIVISLCESLDFKKQSREATALMMVAFLAVASSKNGFLTGGGDLPMGMALVDGVMGLKTGWLQYATWNLLPATVFTIMSVAIVIILLPAKVNKDDLRNALYTRYAELGPMRREEKVAAVLLVITLIVLITDKLHGMTPGMGLILLATVSFLPGVKIMDGKKIKEINFCPIFFVMGCMAIGSAGNYLKVTQWMADSTFGYMEGLGLYATSICTYLVGVVGNFILTPLAATVSFSAPIAELGVQMGLEPRILYLSFKYGFDNYLFPYEYAVLLIFYGFGYIHFGSMVKVLAARMILTIPFLLAVAIPWWQWIM